jgi:CheY-like chemotaxis protein
MTEITKTDRPWVYSSKFYRFQELMRNRVHEILLVSSLYDSYILEEDGRIDERLISEYIDLNLTNLPAVTRVETATEALKLARDQKRFDLTITTMRLGEMDALEFAAEMHKINPHMPIVLLSYDYRELKTVMQRRRLADFEKVFVWQGDFRILLAIVKFVEDKRNVEEDTKRIGVQSIILIEDSVRFYSSYLPLFYTELMYQGQRVLSDSINQSHRMLRMRARPKILLCSVFEEAWDYYQRYHENILGVISDIEFPRNGLSDPEAGITFTRSVR